MPASRSLQTASILLLCVAAPNMALDFDAKAPAGDLPAVPLPGAPPLDPTTADALRSAWSRRPAGYQPRTKHLQPDGTPTYTNRLFLESSPYLRQHAHNPVNWYPWGDEAFATAKRLGRPVLLSVGYSTCHWCHVMEEESFEDVEIARFLNEHYIVIKVDREERPDIDAVYMSAVQKLTGGGGWPMTVWLTPERKPFYGGTYYPPRDGDRGIKFGFLTLLQKLEGAYRERPQEVADSAESLARSIETSLSNTSAMGDLPTAPVLRLAAAEAARDFDPIHGGTKRAPKFPSNVPSRFLLRYHRRAGDAQALKVVTVTLEKMAAGGIYDHVGGGFHRYSTDAEWLVPHFEKMLYDNALLAVTYLEAYQVTGRPDFAGVTREILRYVERDMTSPEGGFYSATDADSLAPNGRREEGWFFTWTPAEIEATLGAERARAVAAYYGVTAQGNFDGRNILHISEPLAVAANRLGLEPGTLASRIEESKRLLYEARAKRPAPLRDEKILASWNGLMISAFARAAFILGDERYAQVASRAADFILNHMRENGRLLRSYKDGKAHRAGYLDDHAFLIAGLLDLYEATNDSRWLGEAIALDGVLEKHFEDSQGGGYFMTADDHETLLAREKPGYDGAEPSGNSVQALNLLRLHEWTTDDRYRQRAERTLRAFGTLVSAAPDAMSEMLLAVDFNLDVTKEIVIVTPNSRSDAETLLAPLRTAFVPNRVITVASEGGNLKQQARFVPLLEGKEARGGKATAYVCKKRVCDLPTSDPDQFARLLREVQPLDDRSLP
jgi:uncharacterized protein YyaL (SSP411 family)